MIFHIVSTLIDLQLISSEFNGWKLEYGFLNQKGKKKLDLLKQNGPGRIRTFNREVNN